MKSPLITMTAVTGKPTKSDIYDYLKGLQENGIEQAMIYPRSGCEIEYLSKEWFDTIQNFLECANALDMCIWLYDDFNWPSGDAGGRVTAVPEYRLKAISTRGESVGKVSYKSQHNSGLFGEKYFPDLLSSDAVDYFIKCTHEEYYKRFSKYFGNVIKGIFTDEPSIGYCCHDDFIPYYDGIEDDYRSFCGRDFNNDMHASYEGFYLNAISVISDRFCSCYVDKIALWCKEHDILMTGHLMQDNDPLYSVRHSGRILKNLSHFSLPGIDEIFTCFEDTSDFTLLSLIEYARGENGAMAELFALGPCDMSFAKRRAMIYLMACHGVDHYFLAISHMDMRGNALVKDFFSNFSPDQPNFAGMKLLADEARVASSYAKKTFTPDVYIRYPFIVSANNITKGLNQKKLFDLVEALMNKHIQWKFIDDEIASDIPVIEINDELDFTIDDKPFEASMLNSKIIVTDSNGDPPKGIFVRRFDDGSLVVLNLLSPAGRYFINGKCVFLDRHAVLVDFDDTQYEKKALSAEFDVKYASPNMIRTMHLNDVEQSYVVARGDVSVVIAVRNDTDVRLNDLKIPLNNNSDILPRGMRGLYKTSDPVSIKSGMNTINTQNDLKYLPSVILIGDFSANSKCGEHCIVELEKRVRKYKVGEKIFDFGKIELSCEVMVPNGAKAIELQGVQMYTKMYADNEFLGEKITSPYIFELKENLWGRKINLSIEQFSSIAPSFGNVDYWDKNSKSSQWRGTPSPSGEAFGFNNISWCF